MLLHLAKYLCKFAWCLNKIPVKCDIQNSPVESNCAAGSVGL